MPEADDYAEPGQRDPYPGSPLFSLIVIAIVLLLGFLPCWILGAAWLMPFD